MSTLFLDGDLARSQLAGDLLVEQTRDNSGQHVTLARRQGGVSAAKLGELVPFLAGLAVTLDSAANGVEQVLLAKRLRQKLNRARLHCSNRHGDVAVAGEENDRQGRICVGKLSLEIQPAQPRQADVEH